MKSTTRSKGASSKDIVKTAVGVKKSSSSSQDGQAENIEVIKPARKTAAKSQDSSKKDAGPKDKPAAAKVRPQIAKPSNSMTTDTALTVDKEIMRLREERDAARKRLGLLEDKLLNVHIRYQAAAKATGLLEDPAVAINLRHHIAELEVALHSLQAQLTAVYNSTSWKSTQWLRNVVIALRGKTADALPDLHDNSDLPKPVDPVKAVDATSPKIPQDFSPVSTGVILKPGLRIVSIGDGPIPSIILSLNQPLTQVALEHDAILSLNYESDLPSEETLAEADIVFIKRACMTKTVEMARFLKKSNIPFVYMLDDDFSEIPKDTPLGRRYAELNGWANVQSLCGMAEHVVVWSKALENKLRPAAQEISQFTAFSNVEIFDSLEKPEPREPGLIVGYAGGIGHGPDLELVREPVLAFLEAHPEARFESIGLDIEYLKGHPRYTHIEGHNDLKEYYRLVASRQWDFVLVPLKDSKGNAAKSDNKLREHGAAGIPAIYSRVVAYENAVEEGVTGLLVPNEAKPWRDAMETMASNPALRKKIAGNAMALARGRYGRANVIKQYEAMIARLTNRFKVLAVGPCTLPTFAIDIDSPFHILAEQGIAKLRRREVYAVTDEDIAWATTIVLVRAFEPEARDIMQRAHKAGVKVIYSFDDNWFKFPVNDTELSTHIHKPENRQSLIEVLKGADMIKATTDIIRDQSLQYNSHVMAFPYGFDFSLIDDNWPDFRHDGRVRIGFYGTMRLDNEFSAVFEALKIIQSKYDNVDLEFFGFVPDPSSNLKNVKSLPFIDSYRESIQLLYTRHWDIGLSPLADTEFNRSKLPTKYRDYAAVGAAGVYSRLPVYEQTIPKNAGILVDDSTQAWVDALTRLVENQSLRESIAMAAAKHVRKDLSADQAARNWHTLLRRVHEADT